MAGEKPQIGIKVKFGINLPFAKNTAIRINICDPVTHEHWWQWQLWVSWAEHLSFGTAYQFIVGKRILILGRHYHFLVMGWFIQRGHDGAIP